MHLAYLPNCWRSEIFHLRILRRVHVFWILFSSIRIKRWWYWLQRLLDLSQRRFQLHHFRYHLYRLQCHQWMNLKVSLRRLSWLSSYKRKYLSSYIPGRTSMRSSSSAIVQASCCSSKESKLVISRICSKANSSAI